ncbi:hypothetical protein RKD34_008376, partial [Streptomyces sp. SAI-218]
RAVCSADTTRRRYAADSGFAGMAAELRSAYRITP